MMFSDDEIKEEGNFTRPGDQLISIREVYLDLDEKFDKKDWGIKGEGLLANPGKNDVFRDGFFPFGPDSGQAKFAWTEEDLVSEPGFGTGTDFGKDLDAALKSQMKEADTSSSVSELSTAKPGTSSTKKCYTDLQTVTSTSSTATSNSIPVNMGGKSKQQACKVDKTDPRSRFHFVKYLKRHGRTVRLWECGICSREFQHQYTLMRHLPTHTDERNFHCDVCGKSFRQLSTLSQHRAIHSTDRPYSCEICRKTFNRVSTLISHRKTHSEQKLYRCHLCPKGFHQKGNLRNHLFTHTNERPYRCDICKKGFNQQSNLVCHKNKAHPEDCTGEISSVSHEAKPITPRKPASKAVAQPDSTTIKPSQQCEVSSSNLPSPWKSWEVPSPMGSLRGASPSSDSDVWTLGSGVLVEPIKTFHMGVAMATKQTPFALLHADDGAPVLVKVVETTLPGGKQMLVPATAEDLRVGGRIVVNNEGPQPVDYSINPRSSGPDENVQIRVPVVATVVPKYRPGGGLQFTVEEPHHVYHTALSADGQVAVEPCVKPESSDPPLPGSLPAGSAGYSGSLATGPAEYSGSLTAGPAGYSGSLPAGPAGYSGSLATGSAGFSGSLPAGPAGYSGFPRRLDPPPLTACPALGQPMRFGNTLPSTCTLPPPSPPLDFISLDLFEPMQCLPMGPQITAVDNIDHPPHSDDSDIFIGDFNENIALD